MTETQDRRWEEDRDDDYGRAFVALLRRGQGADRVDLAGTSLRAARTVRRRRRRAAFAVAVAGVATLVSVAAMTALPDRTAQPATPTVAVPTNTSTAAPPDRPSTIPATVTVDATLRHLPADDPAGVQWVQDGRWHQADGRVIAVGLPADADQGVQAFSLGRRLLVTGSTPAERRTTVIVDPDGRSVQLNVDGQAFTRGPAGSVLWLEQQAGQTILARLTTDQVIERQPLPRRITDIVTSTLAATRDAVYISAGDTVTRYTTTGSTLADPQFVPGVEEAVTSDPDGDTVVFSDNNLCTSVVPTATSKPQDWECRYHVNAVSQNGRYRYGYDVDTEDGTITDDAGHTLMILKNIGSADALVDDTGTVQLIGTGPGPDEQTARNGIVVCHRPRTCNQVGKSSNVQVNSGHDPIALIR